MTECYKIVRWEKVRGEWVSRFAEGPLSVTYREGEWAEAPVGGLFAFRMLKAARLETEYAGDESLAVFRCTGEEPVAIPGEPELALLIASWVASTDAESVMARVREWWAREPTAEAPGWWVAFRRLRLLDRVV